MLLPIALFCMHIATHSQFVTVAIVATNDIHGTALPASMVRSDTNEEYKYGGLAYMGGLIEIIKN